MKPITPVIVVCTLLTSALFSHAAVLLDDTWADGTRNNQNPPTQSAWFGNSSSLSVTPGHLIGTTTTSSRQWTTYFANSPVSLNDGDVLKISLLFRPTTTSANTSRNMRFGLFDYSGGTQLIADGTPSGTGVKGYSLFLNFAPTFGTSNPLQINERTNTASGDLQGTSSDFELVAGGGVNGAPAFASGGDYRLEFSLTRNSPTSVGITATIFDSLNAVVVTATGTDNTALTTAFNAFSMRPSATASTAATFDFTEFKVEVLQVPEPSTMAFLGIGLAGLVWCLRARR